VAEVGLIQAKEPTSAPTAGLHFTAAVLDRLAGRGVAATAPTPSGQPSRSTRITPVENIRTRKGSSLRISPASGTNPSRVGPDFLTTDHTDHTEKCRKSGSGAPYSSSVSSVLSVVQNLFSRSARMVRISVAEVIVAEEIELEGEAIDVG
jgi:hypothetical protein